MMSERDDGSFILSSPDAEYSRVVDREEGIKIIQKTKGRLDMSLYDPATIAMVNMLLGNAE